MPSYHVPRLVGPAAAVLALAAVTACSSTTASTAGQPAPPAAQSVLARKDVLNRAQIDEISPHSMLDLLSGRFPGVQVLNLGSPRIVIRGFADPLVVEDGVPLADPSEIWTINPSDVEQIQILKGEETVLYGSRGGHGVILVTTRRH